MGKKRKRHEQKGAPPWLVSMGDMNNLLMCFFIVMMGDISEVTKQEYMLTHLSFKGYLGVFDGGMSFSKDKLPSMGRQMMNLPAKEKGRALSQQMRRAAEVFKPEIQSKFVRITEDERGLIITLMSDIFFDPGTAQLKPNVRNILKKVGSIIKSTPNFVRIEGHTDNSPITIARAKGGYDTNWELSGARSLKVLRYFTDEEDVNPKQLSSVAFGEQRPIEDNDTPEGRAYNRRVDIVILKEKFLEASKHKKINKPLPDEEWR